VLTKADRSWKAAAPAGAAAAAATVAASLTSQAANDALHISAAVRQRNRLLVENRQLREQLAAARAAHAALKIAHAAELAASEARAAAEEQQRRIAEEQYDAWAERAEQISQMRQQRQKQHSDAQLADKISRCRVVEEQRDLAAARMEQLSEQLSVSQAAHAALVASHAAAVCALDERVVTVKQERFNAQVDAHGAEQQADKARAHKRKADEELAEEAKRHKATGERLSELQEELQCKICFHPPQRIWAACQPCGHLVGCVACVEGCKHGSGCCPICNARIEKVQRMHL